MEKNIDALTKYNEVMSRYPVQRAYQRATFGRKNNHRNIRLQDMAMVHSGYTGKTYKPLDKLTKAEAEFLRVFKLALSAFES